MDDTMQQSHVTVAREGCLGIVQLDRPKALNALDHPMITGFADGLAALEADPAIAHIAITSTNSRAFCAGGDMRRIRELVLNGDIAAALSFFRDEFALNQAIADCTKPIIAFVEGICMGGGLGISIHARYRIVAPTATFAMPETAIGYFPDVGATYFLNALPGNTGRWLGLTGARLNGTEACTIGLGTHAADSEQFPEILFALGRSKNADAVLSEYAREASLRAVLDAELDRAFEGANVQIIERFLHGLADGNPRAAAALKAMETLSPHAIGLADRLLSAGAGATLKECLESEYSALEEALAHPDFAEGVRSVLVDKDHSPKWAS